MVTEQRYAWGKFVAILVAMALLLRVSPALTQTEPYPELDWQFYIACNLLLAAAYYPLAGRSTETLGRKQLWLMVGGLVLYAAVSWFTNIFRYPNISTITLRLGVVVPILMGLGFGPAVGFVVGAAGNHLGDSFSGWGFFPMWNMGNGLMGFVAGLIIATVVFVFAGFVIAEQTTVNIKQEAVNNGAAEWKVTTNGVAYFEWKKND